jgi:phosphohistidine phosphatase
MECLLIRHGRAVAREEWDGKDIDRPLTAEGTRRVRQAVAGLCRLEVYPTVIYSSPAKRAVETTRLLQNLLARPSLMHLCDALLPEACAVDVVSLLQDLPPESCVICIGHEPQLGLAASVLLSGRESSAFPLKKAGACLIELSTPWKPGQGILRWWLTPSQLRAIGTRAR